MKKKGEAVNDGLASISPSIQYDGHVWADCISLFADFLFSHAVVDKSRILLVVQAELSGLLAILWRTTLLSESLETGFGDNPITVAANPILRPHRRAGDGFLRGMHHSRI